MKKPTQNPTHWLTLFHAPGLSACAALRCIEHFGSAAEVCSASSRDLRAVGLKPRSVAFIHSSDSLALRQDSDWLNDADHHLLAYADQTYPARLREIKSPPLLLFCCGNPALIHTPQITVVGSRCPTGGGLRNTRLFCSALADAGFTITSGLAAGIDTCAHQTALTAEAPTIAVVGTGMNVVYPARNEKLSRQIAEHGALISEFSCATPPRPQNFPCRNRIMSGLSSGVLVIEAAEKSGSLITANVAAEQGREVFAVPGSIHNPQVRGCHQLIQSGAKLAQSLDDIISEIHPDLLPAQRGSSNTAANNAVNLPQKSELSDKQKQLLNYMDVDEPITIDALAEACGLPVAELSSMLLILELEGYVSAENHTYVRLI